MIRNYGNGVIRRRRGTVYYGFKLLIMLITLTTYGKMSNGNNTISTTIQTTTLNSLLQTLKVNSTELKNTTQDVFCVKPAIEQFPNPIMDPELRKHGGFIIYILICIYSFLGLAIVCDNYFVSSLDRICEELKLSADVAGATFMAAGSSAPELATVIIGVFLAEDDIGISGVIGSAVFNIMFVIAICGLCATTTLHLSWWPLCRDCFFYTISILVMLIAISNDSINWIESVILLAMYVVYCIALYFNEQLEAWVRSLPMFEMMKQYDEHNEESYINIQKKSTGYSSTDERKFIDENCEGVPPPPSNELQDSKRYYKPKEQHEPEVNPLEMPENATVFTLLKWRVLYPLHYLAHFTIPDCRMENYRNLYPATFVISMIWISFYSYIMVWMIAVIGYTFKIPDTVMGLTFLAAGVSVPDALSSLAVVKEGYGDMAVSNAVGSNVFDILVCLGLPWFLKTAIINPGTIIRVYSKGLTYSTISLLSTVVALIFFTHLNGWKLNRKYGIMLMIGYFIFIIFASLYEFDFFGNVKPIECVSEY